MSSLPTRGSRAAKQHQRKPYERPPPSPAPQLARSKSSFFNTVKALVVAPLSWLSGTDTSNTTGANGPAGEGRHLKRRASRNRVDHGEGNKSKRMRTTSPPRIPQPISGYLDPPEQMLRHAVSATFPRSAGFKSGFTSDTSSDFTQQTQGSIRNTPLHFNSLYQPLSPTKRTPSVGPWFPQPTSTRNSLGPRASQVHFGTLPTLNIDAAIASHDDSRMLSPSPSVSVGLGRERTPSRALPGREPSVSLPHNRVSISRATGASMRTSLSAANPFASLGKSTSAAHERKRSSLIWDDSLGVTSANNTEAKAATPVPSAKNTAERLLNALENMHTHTGDAQRPRRRPPPSVQVPTPGPSMPDKLKRMIQPYGEVKVSPGKGKDKPVEGRPRSGLMKILMKNKKESQAEQMDVEEESKSANSSKAVPVARKPSKQTTEKAKGKAPDTDKTADIDMDSQSMSTSAPTASPALKVIDNFRPASQPPSRPGTSSSLRQSKTVTKRAHAPSAGRNRFSANNDDVEDEDDDAVERRNAELLAVAETNVFKVPEGFKFGGSITPALSAPKPIEKPKTDASMEVVSPMPIPAKSTPTPILSFTPIAPPKSNDAPATPAFFSDKAGGKSELPKVQNPFASLGGFNKPEIKVPEVPKWGSAPISTPAPAPAASAPKPAEGVSVFANIGVSTNAKPVEESVSSPFSFGGPAEKTPAPAPEKPSEPATKPLFGTGTGFSFEKPTVAEHGANPFAGIGASKSGSSPTPAFSFDKPATAASAAPKSELAPEPTKPVEAPNPSVSPFSLGAREPAQKTTTASPVPFSFGAPPAPVPSPSLIPPTFSFGSSSTSSVAIAAPTPQPAPATFSFGTASVNTPSPAPVASEPPKKSPFDFSPSSAVAPTVPAEAPKKSPFDFSPAAAAPTTSKSPFDFSVTAKPVDKPASPFAFATSAPARAPVTTEKKNPFDFSTAPKPASTGFVFGAPAPTPAASTSSGFTFGAPAPARPATPPSGGDAAMEESPTREPAKIVTSGFGNNSRFGAQAPSTGFSFGNAANGNGASSTGPFGGPLTAGNAPQANSFGASATPSSPAPFSFGANNGAGSGFGGNGFNTNGGTTPAAAPAFSFNGGGGGFPQPASASASPSNPFTQPTGVTPFGQPNPAPANAFPAPASPFPAASPALTAVSFNTGNSGSSNAFPTTNGFPGSPATQPGFPFGASAPTINTASPSTFTFGLPNGGASSPATPTATSAPFVFGQGAGPSAGEGSPAAGVQFNLGTADASPGGRKIKPLRRRRN